MLMPYIKKGLLLMLLHGLIAFPAAAEDEHPKSDDQVADISILDKANVGDAVYIFLKYGYGSYDNIVILSRSNSKGDFTTNEVIWDQKKIDGFFEKHKNLRPGKRYITEAEWNKDTQLFQGQLVIVCYGGSLVKAPFHLSIKDLTLTPLDYKSWEVEE